MERQRQWRIAQKVPDAIIVLDARRIIQFANDAAALLADVPEPSHLIGQSYVEILKHHRVLNEDGSPADPRHFPSEIAFREGKETRNRIYSEINRKGRHHWLSVSAFPLPEESGTVELVGIIFEDISRRKLREDRLRFLIESSKILSITTDLDTRIKEKTRLLIPSLADWATVNLVDDRGTLTRVAVEHRHRDKSPLVERFAALAAEDKDAIIYRVAKSGTSALYPSFHAGDIQAPTWSDEQAQLLQILKPCSAIIVPIQTSKVLGVLSLAYTEESGRHYAAEDVEFMEEYGRHLSVTIENARLYQEIAKRDASKDAFLATLSHELRNPLAPIKSSLELIKLKNHDDRLLSDISVIEHQFDHMEKLLRDLLDVTRFTLGKVKLTHSALDLSALARMVASTHRPTIEQKGIDFMLSTPEHPVVISGDPIRIEQVLTNLLDNAEKFTLTGGSISLAVREMGNNAIITVSDTGVGIPPEEIGKVFEKYFQGGGKIPHKSSGLGMGLVLVREIVGLHGGSVYVASEGAGAGSTFTVSLPLQRTFENQNGVEEKQSADTGRPGKILVIDDNKDAADSLVKLLSAVGYEASAAYSGADGIGSFDLVVPDHVIIDIGMPDISGYDVARELRDKHGDSAHLIALSGYGMEEDKRRAREAGFDQHLTKPVGLADLRSALEGVS